MKLFYVILGITVLLPMSAAMANASREIEVEIDKGTLVLWIADQNTGVSYKVETQPNCKSEVVMRQTGNTYSFEHSTPKTCPAGQIINLSVESGSSIRISHGGGMISVNRINQLKHDFSLIHFKTDGGLIQGKTNGFQLEGIALPTDATFQNKSGNGNSLSIHLAGGVIELR
jgi:hypothetical protein